MDYILNLAANNPPVIDLLDTIFSIILFNGISTFLGYLIPKPSL